MAMYLIHHAYVVRWYNGSCISYTNRMTCVWTTIFFFKITMKKTTWKILFVIFLFFKTGRRVQSRKTKFLFFYRSFHINYSCFPSKAVPLEIPFPIPLFWLWELIPCYPNTIDWYKILKLYFYLMMKHVWQWHSSSRKKSYIGVR